VRSNRPNRKMKTRPRPAKQLVPSPFRDIPIPVWLYDPKTLNFLDVNAAALKRYGYTRKEFLKMTGRSFQSLIIPLKYSALPDACSMRADIALGVLISADGHRTTSQ
jgi:PAS domain-containing protein